MASSLESAIARNRSLLLSADVDALTAINTLYEQALDRLRPMIALVEADVARMGGVVDEGAVFRLERYVELERQLREELDRLGRILTPQTATEQARALTLGVEAARDLATIQGGARISQMWVKVPTGAMEQLSGMLSDGSPFADLFNKIGPDALAKGKLEITNGMALGKHPNVIADAITKVVTISKHRAMSISRDAILGGYRNAALENYRANSDLGSTWTWLSGLSGSCAACVYLHGRSFPLSVQFMPTHTRCRCTPIFNVHGATLDITPGDEWFAKQTDKYQDGILNGSGGAAYRAGDVSLGDFVRLHHDDRWGDSYQQVSAVQASRNAQEGRRAA